MPDESNLASAQVTTPEGARDYIGALKGGADKTFVADFLSGKKYAEAEMNRLEELAFGAGPAPEPEPLPEPDTHRPDIDLNRMNEAQRATHDRLFEGAKSPEAYRINVNGPLDEAGTQQLTKARTWLHAAGVPRADGEFIGELAQKEGAKLAAMNPAQREDHRLASQQKLQRLWGDATPARLADAQRLVREVEAKHPGVVAWLEQTGLGDSYALIAQLGNLAARRYGRK